ncbi:MAG TPA: hypothetical protein VMH30_05910 [Verrucomicrobiae bacterium]|nr:hypothetical protein [Verrucomicrobiae bacterium]
MELLLQLGDFLPFFFGLPFDFPLNLHGENMEYGKPGVNRKNMEICEPLFSSFFLSFSANGRLIVSSIFKTALIAAGL